jgi:homoserine dehydrogenase
MALPVAVGVVGATGLVGGALVKQLQTQAPALLPALRANVRLVGVTNSKRCIIRPEGVPAGDAWKEALQTEVIHCMPALLPCTRISPATGPIA